MRSILIDAHSHDFCNAAQIYRSPMQRIINYQRSTLFHKIEGRLIHLLRYCQKLFAYNMLNCVK